MAFEFKCASCGEIHVGMPSFGSPRPLSYYAVPEPERVRRCHVGDDECIIDGSSFLVRGCIEIPVLGADECLTWGVWVSISQQSYHQWLAVIDRADRSHVGPFFGWLDAWIKPYPDTQNLKTMVHIRDRGLRPFIELEPTDHPLAIEQRLGISRARVAEIYAMMLHPESR